MLNFIGVWTIQSCLTYPNFSNLPLSDLQIILPGALIVAAFGFWDDLTGLPAWCRLLAHFIAVSAILFMLKLHVPIQHLPHTSIQSAVYLSLALLLGAWSINLYNFMDGIDGIAGVESIFVLGVGGTIAIFNGAFSIGFLSLSLLLCITAFLFFNLSKAKVFMGDVGSGFIGFMIAGLAILGYYKYQIPVWVWVLPYSLFWSDASLTLLRRALNKEPWYSAHKKHAYQRLHHIVGWSHKKILALVALVNSVFGGITVLTFAGYLDLATSITITLVILGVYYTIIELVAPFPKGEQIAPHTSQAAS